MTTDGNVGNPFEADDVPVDVEEHADALLRWIQDHDPNSEDPAEREAHRRGREAIARVLAGATQSRDLDALATWVWADHPETPPPRDWLVHHSLPAARVALFTGIGGSGKSTLALQLAAGVASGGGPDGEWIETPGPDILPLGSAVAGGRPVVFAGWEDEDEEFARRLSRLSGDAAPWVSPGRLRDMHIVDLAGRGPLWGPAVGQHISTAADLTALGQKLRDLAEKLGAALIVADPLAAVYSSDENHRGLVRAFLSGWDGWCRAHDCALLLLAHKPKSNQSYSGSSDWQGGVRALWTLSEEKHGPQSEKGKPDMRRMEWKLSMEKVSYGPGGQPLLMGWDMSPARDEAGDPLELRWRVADLWDSSKESVAATPTRSRRQAGTKPRGARKTNEYGE